MNISLEAPNPRTVVVSAQRTERMTGVNPVTGEPAELDVILCPACQGKIWVIFVLVGMDHPHMQCTRCSSWTCVAGTCGRPNANGGVS